MPHGPVPKHENTKKPSKHTAHMNLRPIDLTLAVKIRPKDVSRNEHPDIKADGRNYLVNFGTRRAPRWEIGHFYRSDANEYRQADLFFSKGAGGFGQNKNHLSDMLAVYEILDYPT